MYVGGTAGGNYRNLCKKLVEGQTRKCGLQLIVPGQK